MSASAICHSNENHTLRPFMEWESSLRDVTFGKVGKQKAVEK